jgi:hypothetical protein
MGKARKSCGTDIDRERRRTAKGNDGNAPSRPASARPGHCLGRVRNRTRAQGVTRAEDDGTGAARGQDRAGRPSNRRDAGLQKATTGMRPPVLHRPAPVTARGGSETEPGRGNHAVPNENGSTARNRKYGKIGSTARDLEGRHRIRRTPPRRDAKTGSPLPPCKGPSWGTGTGRTDSWGSMEVADPPSGRSKTP